MKPRVALKFMPALALLLVACAGSGRVASGTPSPAPLTLAPTSAPSRTSTAYVVAVPLPLAMTAPATATPAAAPVATYKVIKTYPHDRNAYTEGLVYENGFLYEGTGLNGQSALRKVDLETGQIEQTHAIPDIYFGEGVTIYGNRIIQLTWQSHIGFVYDKASFQPLSDFHYSTEGWGITHDDHRLIMSDGTATLHFLDPETFQEVGTINVYDDNGPVIKLNELEYIHGEIYANVWQTDRIVRISPQTGQVLGWIDLTGLLSQDDRQPPVDVLNGIAYDAQHDRLFVTGKLWPKLFEIKIIAP
jgi:glutaminyl-peptide cyclotransferase